MESTTAELLRLTDGLSVGNFTRWPRAWQRTDQSVTCVTSGRSPHTANTLASTVSTVICSSAYTLRRGEPQFFLPKVSPGETPVMSIRAYAAKSATTPMAPYSLTRRDPLPGDVVIDIHYCGVRHFRLAPDSRRGGRKPLRRCIRACRGTRSSAAWTKVGRNVKKFKEGDLAAVGCMVDSCRSCPNSASAGLEQYCTSFPTLTYNAPDKHSGGVDIRRLFRTHRCGRRRSR